MLFEFLKPMRGWREFFGEVGIIVLGVLIALGAGQLVDAWQWRQQVKQANEIFENEMGPAIQNAYLRLAIGPCNDARLKEIATKLNETNSGWQGMPQRLNAINSAFGTDMQTTSVPYEPSPIGQVSIVMEGWNNALATGTINHLPYVQSVSLSRAYAATRHFTEIIEEEANAQARLSPLATSRPLGEQSRVAMLQTVMELDRLNQEITGDGRDIIFQLKQAKMVTDSEIQNQVFDQLLKWERNRRGSCVVAPKLPPNADELSQSASNSNTPN